MTIRTTRVPRVRRLIGAFVFTVTLSATLSGCFWSEEEEGLTPNTGMDTPENSESVSPEPIPPADEGTTGFTPPLEDGYFPPEPGPPADPSFPEDPAYPGDPDVIPDDPSMPDEPPLPSDPSPDPYDPSPIPDDMPPEEFDDPYFEPDPGMPEEPYPDDYYEDVPLDVRLQGGDRPLEARVMPATGAARVTRFPARLTGDARVSSSAANLGPEECSRVRTAIHDYQRLLEAGDSSAKQALLGIRGRPRSVLLLESHAAVSRQRLEPLLLERARASGYALSSLTLRDPLPPASLSFTYDFRPGALTPILGDEDALMRSTVRALRAKGLDTAGRASVAIDAADLACDFALGRVAMRFDVTMRDGSRMSVELASAH